MRTTKRTRLLIFSLASPVKHRSRQNMESYFVPGALHVRCFNNVEHNLRCEIENSFIPV